MDIDVGRGKKSGSSTSARSSGAPKMRPNDLEKTKKKKNMTGFVITKGVDRFIYLFRLPAILLKGFPKS